MSEAPRRSKPSSEPKIPSGYRSSRRGSRSLKTAKRAERADKLVSGWNRSVSTARNLGYVLAMGLAGLVGLAIALLVIASMINGIARWSSTRKAATGTSTASQTADAAPENIVLIGEDKGKAVGFLAMRVDAAGRQAFGIVIPEGAFIEVPGQGFEKVGVSFSAGPESSLTAISNYLSVPFNAYAVIPAQTYRDVLKNQLLASIGTSITASNLTEEQRGRLVATLATIPAKNAAFVPLPVKPIKLGSQTYFEPQRAEVDDLLKAWWGVDPNKTAQVTRVIVYNGAGKPGVAGDAAQRLIRGGFRVVDTKNADRFDYKTTTVVVQRGPIQKGEDAVTVLGTGIVKERRTDENVSDLIVIIGNDYKLSK